MPKSHLHGVRKFFDFNCVLPPLTYATKHDIEQRILIASDVLIKSIYKHFPGTSQRATERASARVEVRPNTKKYSKRNTIEYDLNQNACFLIDSDE